MAGRPPFVATDEERNIVTVLAGLGAPLDQIRTVIKRTAPKEGALPKPISIPTLRKHFKAELVGAETKVLGILAGSLVQRAQNMKRPEGAAAAMFLLKSRFGWRETQVMEHTGSLELDLTGATAEELAVLERFLVRKSPTAQNAAANAA